MQLQVLVSRKNGVADTGRVDVMHLLVNNIMAVLGPPSSLMRLSGSHCLIIPCVLLLLQAILPSDFPLVGNHEVVCFFVLFFF